MGKSIVSVRIDDEVKEQWRALADKHGRSFGGYIEQVIRLMSDRELLNDVSALDVIADRLVTISNRLEEITLHNKRSAKVKTEKKSLLDIELFDGLPYEAWERWVTHRRSTMSAPMAYGEAVAIVEKLKGFDSEGINVEALIDNAISELWRQIYLPREAAKVRAVNSSG